jgi:CDP-glucose 4,6-dehydratase
LKPSLDFFAKKRIFVTGHTGFKGSWLCRILLRAGADITGYALDPPTDPALYTLLNLSNDIHSVIGDIRDEASVSAAVREANPEILIHMAAQPIVRESYKNPVYTYAVNVMGTVNLLNAARSAENLRSLVNVTTDKVYENKEWDRGYIEDDVLCGFDPYSNSKSCSELATFSFQNSFFQDADAPAISTARSGNVIGGGDFAVDRILPDCVRSAESETPIAIRNPNSVRPYQHVLECLSGYLLLAQKQYENHRFAGNYNFGPHDESCVTTGTLVKLFCEAWGDGASYTVKPDGGPHEANFLKLDIGKSVSVLDWTPTWDIQTAVRKATDWYKTYRNDSAVSVTDAQIGEFFGGAK